MNGDHSFPVWWPVPTPSPTPSSGLWHELDHALSIAEKCPARAEGIVWRELSDRSGPYYVLKNPRARTYLRLSPREFWLWEQMDGAHSVQTLVADYFLAHGTFAYGLIVDLVQQLYLKGMMQEQPQFLFSSVNHALSERTLFYKLMWPARVLLTRKWAIGGLDAFLGRVYRWGGWVLYTRPAQTLFLLVSIVGLYFFSRILGDTRFAFLGSDLGVNAVAVWLAAILPVIIHEMGHALTVKHYGREAPRGGLMLYFGMPAAFVDTTDIWMEGKRARLAVTWAGPYTGFILGGLCSIIIWFWSDLALAPFLFKMATIGVFISVLNLNPLLKLDGYYLLSDTLEIGRLRERSLNFLRHHFLLRLLKRGRLTRDEIIFVIFGILSGLWTVYVVYVSVVVWNTRILHSIEAMLESQGDIGALFLNGLLIFFALSFLSLIGFQAVRIGQAFVARIRRGNWFAGQGRAALAVGLAAVALTFAPQAIFSEMGTRIFHLAFGIVTLGYGSYLAFNIGKTMRGSPYARAWVVFSAAILLFALAHGLWGGGSREIVRALDAVGLGLAGVAFALGWRLVVGVRGSWRMASMVLFGLGWIAVLAARAAVSPLAAHLMGGLLLTGGVWHWQSLRLPSITPAQSIPRPLTTQERLWDAFELLVEAVLSQLRSMVGQGNARRVEDRFNRLTKARDWQVTVGDGHLIPRATEEEAADLAEVLASALEALLNEAAKAAGDLFARQALARGYDALTWEQREIIGEYILEHVQWAAGLAEQLAQTRHDAVSLLERAPLFLTFTREEIQPIARRMRVEHFARGEDIIRQGESGDRFYILRRGRVTVLQRQEGGMEEKVNELVSGDYFGEAALLTHAPRNATVRALTPVEALSLNEKDFNKLVRTGFTGRGKLDVALRRVGLLRRIPLFKDFPSVELQQVASQLEETSLEGGQTLFQQGDVGDKFYIVESGEVAIHVHLPNGETSEQARRGPGEYFGEIALLMNIPRTATILATQPTKLLALGQEPFTQWVRESHSFEKAIGRAGSRRMLQTTQVINRSLVVASETA